MLQGLGEAIAASSAPKIFLLNGSPDREVCYCQQPWQGVPYTSASSQPSAAAHSAPEPSPLPLQVSLCQMVAAIIKLHVLLRCLMTHCQKHGARCPERLPCAEGRLPAQGGGPQHVWRQTACARCC